MASYRLVPFWSTLGVLTIAGVTQSCAPENQMGSFTVTDSAGVEIVMNHGPAWPDGEGWRVSLEPALSVGTLAGDHAYEFHEIWGITRLSDGTIVVLNRGSNELRYYDDTGRHLRSVGGEGGGPGEFEVPRNLFQLAGDTALVWDPMSKRISFFDRAGEYIRSFPFPPGDIRYFAEALFADRTLLGWDIVRTQQGRQPGLTRGLKQLTAFNLEGDSVGALGLFNDDDSYHGVSEGIIFTARPAFGRTTVFATHETSFFVGTNDGYVIDQYDRERGLTRSIRRDVAIPITDEMFEAEIAPYLEPDGMPPFMQDAYREMAKPDFLPHYSEFQTDPLGNLWVKHYASRAVASLEWTVFDPQGHMLGDIEMPGEFKVFEIGTDYVLGRWKNEDDVEFVRIYELSR